MLRPGLLGFLAGWSCGRHGACRGGEGVLLEVVHWNLHLKIMNRKVDTHLKEACGGSASATLLVEDGCGRRCEREWV